MWMCSSACFSLKLPSLGIQGISGHFYITERLNKIFPCHCAQYLLEVAELDINQSNHSLIGAVCVCVCVVRTHSCAEHQSAESFCRLRPSNILLLDLSAD